VQLKRQYIRGSRPGGSFSRFSGRWDTGRSWGRGLNRGG